MFGSSPPPQNEDTPFHPRSPYGVAKVYAYWVTVNYREAYGMFASNGILFNHESPAPRRDLRDPQDHRGPWPTSGRPAATSCTSATSTPSATGASPATTSKPCGCMLQHDQPDDFVIATGEAHTRRGVLSSRRSVTLGSTSETMSSVDARFFRPAEVDYLLGDATKANAMLGWKPKTSFEELVRMMVDADMNA